MVTELGRQPWVVHGILRTGHAVTPMPGLWIPFATFLLVYLLLAVIVVTLLIKEFSRSAGVTADGHSAGQSEASDHA